MTTTAPERGRGEAPRSGQTPQGERGSASRPHGSPRPADPFGHEQFEALLRWVDDGHDGEG